MKKNVLLIFTVVIITGFTLSACQLPFINVVRGSGDLTTEARAVSDFNTIKLEGAGRLVVTQGSSESLEISAEDNIMGELTSEVRSNTLVLGFQDQPWRTTVLPTKIITYTLTVTDLTGITFNGAGDFEMDSLDTSSLEVTINGAGQINIGNLKADTLFVTIAGTGTISIAGEVSAQTINIDGAGNYQAGDLQTNATVIEINGLGSGTVWAMETLDIGIDGGGTLNYYGSPNITQEINGLGDINNQGEK